MVFRHLLVPIDFDETSEHALEVAAGIARAFEASITVFHVVDLPPYAYANFGASLPTPDALASLEQHARRALDERLRRLQSSVPSGKAILTTGVPWREIVATAVSIDADLIVIGTQRRRWLEHALIGGVAEKVVRTSPVPVLTVPPRK